MKLILETSREAMTPDVGCPLLSSEKEHVSHAEGALKQKLAARNVKRVIATFLFFDVLCVGSFGYLFVIGQAPPSTQAFFADPQLVHLDKQLAFNWLPGVLMVTFTVDAILALAFLPKLNTSDPRWEDHTKLAQVTLFSNAITMIVLTAQRFAFVLSQRSAFVGVAALIYVAIRCLKLRSLYMLHKLLKGISGSQGEHTKYEEFWAYWSRKWSKSWEKRLVRCSCIFALVTFAAIVLLFVYMGAHSVPMGVPPPRQGATSMSTNITALQSVPIALSSVCGRSQCLSRETWYVCGDMNDCPSGMIVASDSFNPKNAIVETAASGASGAGVGVGMCAVFAPEFLPICAVVGGAVGGGAGAGVVAWQVYGRYWCVVPSDLPQAARNALWCAQ